MKKDLTLLFLRREGQILLAMKKRGFGQGRWNGVGGKVEAGESILEATIRECQEEIGVIPLAPRQLGKLVFIEPPDLTTRHHVHLFVATKWEGEARETEEMRPQWFSETDIPFDQMWPDDQFWMPLLLQGKLFTGTFTLNDSEVVAYKLQEVDSLP